MAFAMYLAPVSKKGCVAAWKGKKRGYRGGFVVRLLWLGVVMRWGYRRHPIHEGDCGFAMLEGEEAFYF